GRGGEQGVPAGADPEAGAGAGAALADRAGRGVAPGGGRDHPSHALARSQGIGAGEDAFGIRRSRRERARRGGGGAGGARGRAHRAGVCARSAAGAEPAGGQNRAWRRTHGGGGVRRRGLERGGGVAGGGRHVAAGMRGAAAAARDRAAAARVAGELETRDRGQGTTVKMNLLNPTLQAARPANGVTRIAPRLPRLSSGDLINLSDLNRKEFLALLDLAADIKVHPGRYRDLLSGCGLAMIFEKPSLRTRVTFDVAMQEMGGHAVFLDFTESPLGEREDIVDVARNLELWMDAIVARTFGHESIELLASSSAVPVINGLSDHSHPCQAMADFLTLREAFEDFPAIKLAYVGDGNNTLHSLLEAAALAGITMAAATPAGYEPDATVVARVHALARRSG